eukprot:scaffold145441_cov53-Cyclotella_meneghiniana.AAC.1
MKNALIIGVSYASSCDAFATTTASSKRRTITALQSSSNGRNSPGFVPFSSDDNPIRSTSGAAPNSRRPMADPFAPPSPSSSSRGRWQEPSFNNMMYGPEVMMMMGQQQQQSNLS